MVISDNLMTEFTKSNELSVVTIISPLLFTSVHILYVWPTYWFHFCKWTFRGFNISVMWFWKIITLCIKSQFYYGCPLFFLQFIISCISFKLLLQNVFVLFRDARRNIAQVGEAIKLQISTHVSYFVIVQWCPTFFPWRAT